MNVPTTYAAWVDLLNKFGNGDDSVLEIMRRGRFTIDAGTAERFYLRVEDAYKKRKVNWLEKFQRAFNDQSFKTEDDFAIALRNGKQNLLPVYKFLLLEVLPEDIRKTLQMDLDNLIIEIRQALKNSTSGLSSGREKILLLLNVFSFTTLSQAIEVTAPGEHLDTNTTSHTGRKIIFQDGK